MKLDGKLDRLFLDSGTYSEQKQVHQAGWIDNYDAYMETVRRVGKCFDHIACYDGDFSNPEKNAVYFDRMRLDLAGTGLEDRIVPAVHSRANAAEEFELYLAEGARCIAVGSWPPIPEEHGQDRASPGIFSPRRMPVPEIM